MTDRPWTSSDDEILRSMREEDLPRGTIATRLDRSVTAVAHRIDRLKLGKQYFQWTPERDAEIRRMRELDPPESYHTIAAALGCSRNAAIGRAARIGIKNHGYGARAKAPQKPKSEWRKFNFLSTNIDRKRQRKEKPTPVVELVIPYNFIGVGFFDLQAHHCRFPHGEAHSLLFCGNQVIEGTSWCAHCARVVYDQTGTLRSRRKQEARRAA